MRVGGVAQTVYVILTEAEKAQRARSARIALTPASTSSAPASYCSQPSA